jgi:hypothetical protein
VLFFTLAIWALLDFFRDPTRMSGLKASLFCGLYLISHGYIIPFIPCLIALTFLFADSDEQELGFLTKPCTGIRLLAREMIWFFPYLFFPLYYYPLLHTFNKAVWLGFFAFDHLPGFIDNIGYPLTLLILFSVASSIAIKKTRLRQTLLFTICGAFYLAPLFFGTPPGITVVRGYMLLGTYSWLLCALGVLDALLAKKEN